jgi:CDP-diacylglycerol--glycerol-3-phosphate 3-phosphatidyltransferase
MNIPNTLTIIRILLTPVFVYLFIQNDPMNQIYGVAIYFFASFTDWFDGFYARKFNVVTRFGQFMDPLADKILNLSATYVLAIQGYVFWWIIATIIFRDIFVTVFRMIALIINEPVITSRIAQWKTAIHMLLLFLNMGLIVLANLYEYHLFSLNASYSTVFGIGWLVVALISVYTAIDYIIYNWSLFIKMWRLILKKLRLI